MIWVVMWQNTKGNFRYVWIGYTDKSVETLWWTEQPYGNIAETEVKMVTEYKGQC